ncbi:hypothetical protein I5W35_19235 [Stenotrophomonas maltophilia]|nr:hypothetical protein [Stenotrophomonas maltophilia]
MSDQANSLEIPVPTVGPGGVLRAVRSEYGNYYDFELRGSPEHGGSDNIVALLSGYAARLQVSHAAGGTLLVVGNTSVLLPRESGQQLADFLGVPLETKQQTGEG